MSRSAARSDAADDAGSGEVFVSRFNRVLAVVVWAVTAVVVGGTIAAEASSSTGDVVRALLALLPGAFVALFAWSALWAPCVRVDDAAATLVNATRTIRVPWAALVQVDTKHALTLVTPSARFASLAAPAPGRMTTTKVLRSDRRQAGSRGTGAGDAGVRPGDLLSTDSGDAAYLVRDRWQSLVEAGRVETGVADAVKPGIRWHVASLSALAALAVASLAVQLL